MLSDDLLYVGLLLASIGWGFVTTHPVWESLGGGHKPTVNQFRKTFSTLFGLAVVVLVSGKHTLHPVIRY